MVSVSRSKWAELSESNPHRTIGLEVLDHLMRLEFGTLPISRLGFKREVSPAHVFHDLYRQKNPRYRNQLDDIDTNELPFYDFVSGWVALAQNPGADVADSIQTPYSASDILALPGGLGDCIPLPESLCAPDVVVRPVDIQNPDSGPRLTTTISPVGSISDPHIDGCGSGLFLVQLFGEKLLFTWPATVRNLEWMEDRHGIKRGPLKLLSALQILEGMSITLLQKNDAVELEPGMIHAVMSLSSSGIAGWDFAKASWLLNKDLQRQMLWEAGMAKKQKVGLLSDRYDIGRYLADDLRLWQLLGEKSDPNTLGMAIGGMLRDIRELM